MTCHCCPWCDQPHDCSPDCNRPDCPACEDRGEVDTGRTEADTGMPITVPCPYCTPKDLP